MTTDDRCLAVWDYVKIHGPIPTYALQRALDLRGNIDSLLATMESHGYLLAENRGMLSIFSINLLEEVNTKI